MAEIAKPVEKWIGSVKEVKLGDDGRESVILGGETTLPFLHFEGAMPNRPLVAVEIHDIEPSGWPPLLLSAWGGVVKAPVLWAKAAVQGGADIIVLRLRSAHPEAGNTGADEAKRVVDKLLGAVSVPLIIMGPEVTEKDNEVLLAASEVARGVRIGLGRCTEKNYRTIAATCLVNNHVAIASTPNDVNLAKQLNILLHEVGLPLDSIIHEPSTGALGYGLEYTYSVLERLRLSALIGDEMMAVPVMCSVGEESWRQKESRSTEGIPVAWGDNEQRAITWEALTALPLVTAGASIVVLRHPQTVAMLKAAIDKLMKPDI